MSTASPRPSSARVRQIDYDYWVELSDGIRLAAGRPAHPRRCGHLRGPSDWALGMAQEVARGPGSRR